MSPSAADYVWFLGSALHESYCMTLVRDVTPGEFLSRLGAAPHGERHGLSALIAEYWDADGHRQFIGATSVRGADASWTLAVEINGYLGRLGDFMAPVSAGTRIVSHSRSVKAVTSFNWWEDGELRTHFEWPAERWGSAPDALVDAMTRVGFDLDPRGEDPGTPGKMALAEELTGVRITADLLADASYVTGIVSGRSGSARPRKQGETRKGLGRVLGTLVPRVTEVEGPSGPSGPPDR